MPDAVDATAPDDTGSQPATPAPEVGPRTYYLIDGSGYIFRAFHALPMMTRPADKTPVNAVYGFSAMVLKLLGEIRADHIGVIFDAARENFRNQIYDQYKANRTDPPEELVPQFPLIRAAVEAFGLPMLEMEGFEADDLIATFCRLAKARGDTVVIVSSDKDLMQLVGDGVTMFDPMKNKVLDVADVVEKFGVEPSGVVDVQALAGDSVDNVPGVPGIGIKTAAQLIRQFGDLDALLDQAETIKQPKRRQALIDHAEMARISRDLVRLKADIDLPLGLDDLKVPPTIDGALVGFLKEQGFKSLVARVEAQIRETGGIGGGASADRSGAAQGHAATDTAAAAEAAPTYELVTDETRLTAWIEAAIEAGMVAVDTETTSLGAAKCDLVGVSLATAPGRACYIPLAHVATDGAGTLDLSGEGAPQQIPIDRAIALLKPLLEDPSVLKVGQNLKYDYHVLARRGITLAPTDDTMLMSYVLDGGSNMHGMDELARLHLDRTTIKYTDVVGTGKSQVTFDRVPLDKALDYAAEDADITLRLHRLFKPRLLAERMVTVYETIERPLVQVIGEMERTGIRVDRAVLDAMSRDLAGQMERLETEVHTLVGHSFNIGSPKQLGQVLFEEMGIPGGKKSAKTGAYSTDSSVLETIAAQGHTVADKVLEYRQLSKLKGTYTDALPNEINPRTGRIHTSFSLAATNTGRLSSNDPNLQNIPIRTENGRKIRTAFITDPGWTLISVDYSQIELRLVADIAGIEALKHAFRAGIDIHAMTASQVFGVPLDEMTGEIRRKAKAINFGIIYGISGFGLANQLKIPQSEATAFIKAYLERFGELKTWMDETKRSARERGYVTTLFGRKCHVPGIKETNPARRGFAERQAINAPIQGTAADIIKRAMVRLPRRLAAAGLSARMLLQVHDELLFEAPEAEAAATVALVKEVMEGAASLSVPLVAEAGVGLTWGDAH